MSLQSQIQIEINDWVEELEALNPDNLDDCAEELERIANEIDDIRRSY